MKIKKYQSPSGPLVKINGEWVPLTSDGAGNLHAVDKLGKRKNFKVKTKPKSATGNKEIVVTPKGNTIVDKKDLKPKPAGYSSAFQGNLIMTPVRKGFELLGKGLLAGSQALERGFTYGPMSNSSGMFTFAQPELTTGSTPVTDATFRYALPYTMPSRWVGWARTGYAPHREENTGLGDENLNLMFDVVSAPLVFKGIKSTPKSFNSTLEFASDLGSKTARNWRLAREINLNIKNNNVKSPSRYITKDYNYNDDGSVSSIIYLLHDPISGKPLGNGVISSPYSGTKGRPVGWIESQNGAKGVSEDIYNVAIEDAKTYGDLGIESGWDLMEPQKTLAVTKKFPHIVVGESEGHPVRLLTGTTNKLQPYFIQLSNHHLINNNIKYNPKTGNFEEVNPNIINGDKTSLKFFERKPSRISEAERAGVPKGERNQPVSEKPMMTTEETENDILERLRRILFKDKLKDEFWDTVNKEIPSSLILGKLDKSGVILNPDVERLSKSVGFTPRAIIDVGPFNRMYSREILNRLKDLGYNVHEGIPIMTEDGISTQYPYSYIISNSEKPMYLGTYNSRLGSLGGFYSPVSDVAFADPTKRSVEGYIPSVTLHERIIHGTDNILEGYDAIGLPKAKKMYLDFVDKLFFRKSGSGDVLIVEPAPKVRVVDTPLGELEYRIALDDGNEYKLSSNHLDWSEARATVNLLKRKYLEEEYLKAGSPEILEEVRPQYLKKIDSTDKETLYDDLGNINGYGAVYKALRHNNPYFVRDLRNLLKYGAGIVPPIVTFNKFNKQ